MITKRYRWMPLWLAMLAIVGIVLVGSHVSAKRKPELLTFKLVMQLLQIRMNQITEGIMTENYRQIQEAALFIANHPSPALSERKRLVLALGPYLREFKTIDKQVHGSSEKLAVAAQQKNMPKILSHYQTVVTGCVSCHQLIRPIFLGIKLPTTKNSTKPTP